jgi:hypothetical protein
MLQYALLMLQYALSMLCIFDSSHFSNRLEASLGAQTLHWGINKTWISHDSNHLHQQPPISPGDYSPLGYKPNSPFISQFATTPTSTASGAAFPRNRTTMSTTVGNPHQNNHEHH